jgi:hypothetical protein
VRGVAEGVVQRRVEGGDALLTLTAVTAAIPVAAIDQNSTPAMLARWVNFFDLCAVAVRIPDPAADSLSGLSRTAGRYGSDIPIKQRTTGTSGHHPWSNSDQCLLQASNRRATRQQTGLSAPSGSRPRRLLAHDHNGEGDLVTHWPSCVMVATACPMVRFAVVRRSSGVLRLKLQYICLAYESQMI